MNNFEFAKKLKDEGFPQPNLGAMARNIGGQGFGGGMMWNDDNSESAYMPTALEIENWRTEKRRTNQLR